jgi:NADH-quinone oxidoreductase subunit N
MSPDYGALLHALLPEACLVVGALVVLALDLSAWARRPAETRFQFAVGAGVLALIVALGLALMVGAPGSVYENVLAVDRLGFGGRIGVILLSLLSLGMATGAPRARHAAEFVAVVLLATVGFTLMATAQQLLLAFLAIELASLSLYVLAGFDKDRPESAEAALKYFLFGGMSAAFLLFGFSIIYGLTGSIEFEEIAFALTLQGMTPLMAMALVMVLVAFGFKAAAAPFHFWAPDVYQGAPAPSAALVASASKLAGIILFARLLWPGLGAVAGNAAMIPATAGWGPVLTTLAGASLVLGNLVALAQSDVRRLLAYSAIAHAGALLLGVIAMDVSGPGPLYYYAATYGIATVGAFGVVGVLQRAGVGPRIADLASLGRRSPLLAACLAVYVLSLAGIPPLAGFFGKFAVFAAAFSLSGLSGPVGWMTLFAILLSAVALYYYLILLKQAYVNRGNESDAPIPVSPATAVALIAAAALLLILGLLPDLVYGLVAG